MTFLFTLSLAYKRTRCRIADRKLKLTAVDVPIGHADGRIRKGVNRSAQLRLKMTDVVWKKIDEVLASEVCNFTVVVMCAFALCRLYVITMQLKHRSNVM